MSAVRFQKLYVRNRSREHRSAEWRDGTRPRLSRWRTGPSKSRRTRQIPSEPRTGRRRPLYRPEFSWVQLHHKWAEYGSASDATVGHHAKTRAADGVVPHPPLTAAHDVRFYRTRSTHPASLATIATLPSPSKAMWRGRAPGLRGTPHVLGCALTPWVRSVLPWTL